MLSSHHRPLLNRPCKTDFIRPYSPLEVVGRGWRRVIFLLLILFITGCFSARLHLPPQPADSTRFEELLSMMVDQDRKVSSFSATGRISVDGRLWNSGADTLIAGTREPLRVKIEVTHSWGKPLLTILIRDNRIEILEFSEKRFYIGEFSAFSLMRFFPGNYYDPQLIWSMLRGFPQGPSFHEIQTAGPSRVHLLDRQGDVTEVIDFNPETMSLEGVSLQEDSQTISFLNFMESNGVHYASEVRLENSEQKPFVLKNRRMIFNREIPDQFFTIQKPSSFETVSLDN